VAACTLAAALTWPVAASAHVVPQPQFLSTGELSTMSLTGPNERDEPMTGLVVTVPAGVAIVRAHTTDGWTASVEGSTATWNGGPLAPAAEETFALDLDVSSPPGTVRVETTQLYPGGTTVSWPISLTILPSTGDEPSQNLGWALAAGVAGLVVTAGLAALAWRRRTRTLQER
jgi:opacity protein-like surface antigen